MTNHILVSEVFGVTIQGEGALVGQVSSFIRTAGCSFRCTWCDSMHAVDPQQIRQNARRLTIDELMDEVRTLPRAPWMTLSGGDPVTWDLGLLIQALHREGYRVAVETQGALWREWLCDCDLVTCSPKPPSAGMMHKLDFAMLQRYGARLQDRMVLKIVIFDEGDLEFAERMRRLLPNTRLFLSSGTPPAATEPDEIKAVLGGFRKLIDGVLARPALHCATLSPQLHVLVWGHSLGH